MVSLDEIITVTTTALRQHQQQILLNKSLFDQRKHNLSVVVVQQ
jgi:hypothetical protein